MTARISTPGPQNAEKSHRDEAEYALVVQRKARGVAEAIRATSMVKNESWASPLAAAPSAVSTMAILLKTSSSKRAAGIKVTSRDIKDSMGNVIGELSFEPLQSNLEYCSSLGHHAFRKARSTMEYINLIANKMIKDGGSIEKILRAINEVEDEDDEDEDDYDLSEGIKDIQNETAQCLAKITALTGDFEFWYRVIETLKANVIACDRQTQNEANINEESLQKTEFAKEKLETNGKTTSEVIEQLEAQLQLAKENVSKAQTRVTELENIVPAPEPSAEDEQILADTLIPLEKRKKTMFGRLIQKVAGESVEEYKIRVEHQRDVEQRRANFLKESKEKREAEKKAAQKALTDAQARESSLNKQWSKLIADVSKNKEKLASAKHNLDNTEARFKRLSDEKIELAEILEILEESRRELGTLKGQVEELVTFFHSILNEVEVAVTMEVQKEIVRPITNKLMYNAQGVYQGVRLGKKTKQNIHNSAVGIQGNFCAIKDITGVYVVASDRYIMPAIKKMTSLADAKPEDWPEQRDAFTSWCRKSTAEIEALTTTTDEEIVEHMTERVRHLELAVRPVPLIVGAAR
ncbi:hypothetical protein B0J18DRAFT_230057 [Chaetomium sp. MPI-SDFR-AT-0129]|nr:hypothetical protein B0J18DRAFT_230057 [Chaetomium sp. MPI-SDFR-AT-0129]